MPKAHMSSVETHAVNEDYRRFKLIVAVLALVALCSAGGVAVFFFKELGELSATTIPTTTPTYAGYYVVTQQMLWGEQGSGFNPIGVPGCQSYDTICFGVTADPATSPLTEVVPVVIYNNWYNTSEVEGYQIMICGPATDGRMFCNIVFSSEENWAAACQGTHAICPRNAPAGP